MIEEKCIFRDSKDGTGHALKAMQVTEAKRVIKLASTHRQRLVRVATTALK